MVVYKATPHRCTFPMQDTPSNANIKTERQSASAVSRTDLRTLRIFVITHQCFKLKLLNIAQLALGRAVSSCMAVLHRSCGSI